MSEEIKPCPKCGQPVTGRLCGGPAAYGCREWDYEVECECGLVWDFSPGDVDEEEAVRRGIEAWNARAERTCRIDGVCGGGNCVTTTYRLSCGHSAVMPEGTRFGYCPNCGAKVMGGRE